MSWFHHSSSHQTIALRLRLDIVAKIMVVFNSFNPKAWIYHCHLHPPQAANCCRNSRLVVDEDDLKNDLKMKINFHVLVTQFHVNFHYKTLGCRKMKSVYRDVKWYFNAPWGLKGLISRLTRCYWEWNECLNIKICKWLVPSENNSVIFSHLKLWVAVARHNFKWLKEAHIIT